MRSSSRTRSSDVARRVHHASSPPLSVEVAADAADVLAELRRVHHVERARPRQVDRRSSSDAARARRHHQHAVGEEHRLGDRMGDEDHGLAPLEPDALQLEVHLLARHRVERAERLVHQQHRRVVDERAHDRHALLHAAGELPRIAVLEAAETDQREEIERHRSVRARPSAARRPAAARCRARCARGTAPATGRRRRCRGAARRSGCRARSPRPPSGGSRPARILSSVDLPQPDGPTTATNSPSPTAKLIRSRAVTPPSRVG